MPIDAYLGRGRHKPQSIMRALCLLLKGAIACNAAPARLRSCADSSLEENSAPSALPLKQFWESVGKDFAHTSYVTSHSGEPVSRQNAARWKATWLPGFAEPLGWLNGSRIGDYGIGAGLLGTVLCNEYGAASYIGMDIASRSLDAARAQLTKNAPRCDSKLLLLDPSAVGNMSFVNQFQLDALVSQQVIQHFPSEIYTVTWLCTLATQQIPRLLLEVRYGQKAMFNEWQSRRVKQKNVALATFLNCEHLANFLPNYRLRSANFTSPGGWNTRFVACDFVLAAGGGGIVGP